MSRVLIVVPPLVGHVNPTVGLGAALAARGHEVAWAGHAALLQRLLPDDATIHAIDSHLDDDGFADLTARGEGLRGAAAFKFLWQDLFWPLADAMVDPVDAAVASWRPDVLVVDQQALAGAIVATRRGLPWVTSAATSATLVDPLDALPQLKDWMAEGTTATFARHGAPEATTLSPHAVLAFTTEALVGPVDAPPHWHFVGPVLTARPAPPFPWDALRDGRRVLVSLGTVSRDRGLRLLRETATALSALDVQGVFAADPDLLGPLPGPHVVQPFVPQLELLPHVDAVLCHAGHNTVVESLWHDRPLVVAPVRDDQPVVAQQVVAAGAGVRVKFGRAKADAIQSALTTVLDDADVRAAAARIGASFRTAGGAARAATVVASLVP